MMNRFLPLAFAACLATSPVSAGPFDDLSDADRAALGDEIRGYLLENPEVLMEVVAALEARQMEAAEMAEAQSLDQLQSEIFEDESSYVGGNPDGDVTIVEFLDYQCGYCKRAHPEVAELLAGDNDIRIIIKEFPILGPASEQASRAAIAVLLNDGPEAYRALSDAMMEHQGQLTPEVITALAEGAGADIDAMQTRAGSDEVSAIIARNRALGQQLQISGTPTFIIGDEFVRGYLPLEQMQEKVEAQRADM
ncbi:DsbA family protein [Oceanibium sediminis]|uniref:DsbA family protein n=1 Tax=Oceanibium sediminis TaxID=2026339 RepID=UPI001E39C405|nr:DsbA family protein [Oceanibium sediminis]